MLLVYAGNRVDAPDRAEPRFPADAVAPVEQRLRRLLAELGPTGVVGAAASGADLLVLDTARELGIPMWITLPLPPEQFLAASVADQGQEWVDRYRRVTDAARAVDVTDLSDHDDWYLRGNDAILDQAEAVAAELDEHEKPGTLALVIRPADHDGSSATDDFARKAKARGMPVIDLDPGRAGTSPPP